MKTTWKQTVEQIQNLPARIVTAVQCEARHFVSEKRGDANVASMVALTVVTVGAIVAAGTTLKELAPELVELMFQKITESLGLA